MALKFNVPLIFYGENQAEYGNKIDDNKKSEMDKKFFSIDDISQINLGGLPIEEIIKRYKFKINDFEPYIPLNQNDIKKAGIEQQFLGYYKKWDQQEAYYYATQNTGFKANDERTEGTYSKYSSIDDKIDNFHYFTTYIKFGIGRTTYDTAQEIRTGKITRNDILDKLFEYSSKTSFNPFNALEVISNKV